MILMLLGDFNLETAWVAELLCEQGFAMRTAFDDGPTNQWRFNIRCLLVERFGRLFLGSHFLFSVCVCW